MWTKITTAVYFDYYMFIYFAYVLWVFLGIGDLRTFTFLMLLTILVMAPAMLLVAIIRLGAMWGGNEKGERLIRRRGLPQRNHYDISVNIGLAALFMMCYAIMLMGIEF